ncbi:hypothetical protein F383_17788 [Gossypium arboreum]|uniref:Uncharacterized protein n=1 Tax=Gossypium arboreum TaxID=29729 RepID=A0A0B0NQ42_GOSAR|nr:hypothetical protein F383_17788 [Gossypium arboreum]
MPSILSWHQTRVRVRGVTFSGIRATV